MMCDIIIPVWNYMAITKDCVNSIRKNTDVKYRIIIVDNASDDQTRKYLENLEGSALPEVTVIRNEENLGFIKAANQGLRTSDAPYVCLLNNDTIVTKGWLSEMIDVAAGSAEIGIVNPSSNNLGQRPAEGEPVEHYAEKLRQYKGQRVELGAAIGFCMLIKRDLIKKIGVLDEIYGMGNFEDTDYSRRAVQEGYTCVRACAAYVYHRENTSFKMLKTFDEDFHRNKEIFEFRWGKPRRVAYVLDACDENTAKKIGVSALQLARGGSWVWYFLKKRVEVPAHSNIITVELPEKNFYISAAFRILKKKKKFDEINVGDEMFGKVLEKLSVIHKAKIRYH